MAKRILVVDDSDTVRQQVRSALSEGDFDILEAVDGLDGAKKIESGEQVDAVICDINMPNMTGLEMLERIKADGKNAELPVVMLTTEGQPALMKRAKAAGAKGWIVKPFKPQMLVAAVTKLTAA